jgi:glycosyltransferase involved in cell wall biosynthesis
MTFSNPTAERTRVSIVIATRDRPGHLRRCLEAVSRLDPRPLEVIVIDDGAADPAGVAASCESLGLPLQYRSKKVPGTCSSRNWGVRIAKGDYVLFIDDDVLLEPGYLAPVLGILESDPSIGGVGGSLDDAMRTSRGSVRAVFRVLRVMFLLESTVTGRVLPSGFRTHARRSPEARDVQILSTSNSCYRRAVFEHVRFDEMYDRLGEGYAFGEDADFSYRVSRRWRLRITPDAKGFHEYAPPHFVAREKLDRVYVIHHYLFLKNTVGMNPLRAAAFGWAMVGVTACDLLALALRPTSVNWRMLSSHLQAIRVVASGRAGRSIGKSDSSAAVTSRAE